MTPITAALITEQRNSLLLLHRNALCWLWQLSVPN